MIDLDRNASTPLTPEARVAVLAALDLAGNPSSQHAAGRAARAALEDAREQIARSIGGRPDEITLTSGGTESLALGLVGLARAIAARERRPARILTTAIEHPALLEPAQRLGARVLGVDGRGRLAPEALAAALAEAPADLVAFASANNEVGTCQAVRALADVARAAGARVLVDAAQSVGKEPVDVDAWGVDLLAFTAHKFGGPKGAGALWTRRGTPLEVLLEGGGQERGLRAGTPGLPAIAGFGAAAAGVPARIAAMAQVRRRRDRLRERLFDGIAGLAEEGDRERGLPNTLSVRVPDLSGEALRLALDLEGVLVSGGSACSSGAGKPSHVLLALGRSAAEARRALRLSLGPETTDDDIERAASIVIDVVARQRAARAP